MRKENFFLELFHASVTEKSRSGKNKLSSWEGEGLADLRGPVGGSCPFGRAGGAEGNALLQRLDSISDK